MFLELGVCLSSVFISISRVPSELFFLDGRSREAWSGMLHFLDVLAPPRVDAYCCSVASLAVSRRCPSASFFCSRHFLFLYSPRLVEGYNVPVFVFELAQLFNELVEPVVARQRVCVAGSS